MYRALAPRSTVTQPLSHKRTRQSTLLRVVAGFSLSLAACGGDSADRADDIRETDLALMGLCGRFSAFSENPDEDKAVAAEARQIRPLDDLHRRVITGLGRYAELPDYARSAEELAEAEAVISPLNDACSSLGDRIATTNGR